MRKIVMVAILSSFLSGCATGYNPAGLTGGYSDIQLNADTYQISVQGNGYTSADRAKNIALLRAADLTIAAGAERFIIISGGVSQNYAGSTPVVVNSIGNTLIATGGAAIVKPSGNIIIRILRPNDPSFPSAYDAKLIKSQLMLQFKN